MNSIIQWNINGLYSHFDFLKKLLFDQSPAVLCIQETNFKNNDYVSIKNYKCYHKNRINYLAASGGVAIYVDENIHSEEFHVQTNWEIICVNTILESKKITICNIYLPNSQSFNADDLKDIITQLPKPYILLGDFNSHNHIWGSEKTDSRGKEIEKVLNENDVSLLNIGTATHFNIARGKLSCIDLTICSTNITDSLEWKVLENTYDSDHFPILIKSTFNNKPEQIFKARWKFKKANWQLYQREIENNIENLNNLSDVSNHNISTILENFQNLILEAASKSIPTTKNKIANKNLCWWNDECENAVKDAKRAYNNYKRKNTYENQINFKMKRAIARKTIKTNKRNSWIEFISSMKYNTPSDVIWSKIKSINKTKKQLKIHSMQKTENEYTTDPLEIANLLGKNFSDNSSDTNYNHTFINIKNKAESEKIKYDDIESSTHSNHLNLDITMKELKDSIHNSKNTSAGPDDIPNIFIKNLPESAIEYLLKLFNSIWLNKIFPTQWGEATVIPILKPNKNSLLKESYRPIALTCCLCKLLEKIINKRLMWYLETENILSPHQHGFRKHHSTSDNITTITKYICDAFVNKQHLLLVALDMEKAYDMLWRSRIIDILGKLNVRGSMLGFIANFLKNRSIQVRVNGFLSNKFHLQNGVPQGSVLSVTLFLIAINDIVRTVQSPVKFSIYADDITVFVTGKNLDTSQQIMQNTLNKLELIANNNGFKFSKTKTTATLFTKHSNYNPNLNLYMENCKLAIRCQVKILGITFDHNLSWIPHLKILKKECVNRMNILKIMASKNWGADQQIIANTYRTIIQSKIDYGTTAYVSARPHILKMLNPIINTAARLATGAFRTSPTESVLTEANLLPLCYRRKLVCLNYAVSVFISEKLEKQKEIISSDFSNIYKIKKNFPKPFNIRLKYLLKEANLDLGNLDKKKKLKTPFWNLDIPKITRIDINNKHQINVTTIKHMFLDYIQKFTNYTHIYTDASKTNMGSGCAVITPTNEYLYKLHRGTPINQSEAFAMLQAFKRIKELNSQKIVIFSDSLNTIAAIENFNLKSNSTIRQIIEEYNSIKMENQNIEILISWVPSHVEIEGNTKADKAAKEAAKSNLDYTQIPTSSQTIRRLLYKKIRNFWDNSWRNLTPQKLHQIKKSTSDPSPTMFLPRKEQVIINRLRIGHTNITHIHLITKNEASFCNTCYTHLSVKHILTDCLLYQEHRLKNQIPNTIEECLNTEVQCKKIINFLKDINLMNDI